MTVSKVRRHRNRIANRTKSKGIHDFPVELSVIRQRLAPIVFLIMTRFRLIYENGMLLTPGDNGVTII